MRIDRIEASKHKRGRVLVFLEDGACLKITEQELLDFGLRSGDELDEAALRRLREAAGVSSVKAAAADLVGKRAMSRHDLERKLREKGASEADARYAGDWLEAIGAVDDAAYAALLIRHCAQMGYGPARYREELRRHGVDRELWDEAMDAAPPPAEVAAKFLQGRFRGGVPDERERKRAADALVRRGFGWGDVKSALGRYADFVREAEETP